MTLQTYLLSIDANFACRPCWCPEWFFADSAIICSGPCTHFSCYLCIPIHVTPSLYNGFAPSQVAILNIHPGIRHLRTASSMINHIIVSLGLVLWEMSENLNLPSCIYSVSFKAIETTRSSRHWICNGYSSFRPTANSRSSRDWGIHLDSIVRHRYCSGLSLLSPFPWWSQNA